jgi:hypothetical protein
MRLNMIPELCYRDDQLLWHHVMIFHTHLEMTREDPSAT